VSFPVGQLKPILRDTSNLLTESMIFTLSNHLSPVLRYKKWVRLFSIAIDGTSFHTFYSMIKDHNNTVIVIGDQKGYIFGGFATDEWIKTNYFYGRGQSFLFTFRDNKELEVFKWSGENDYIQMSTEKLVAFGGGNGAQYGLAIHDSFLYGKSCPCDTFRNTVLSSTPDFTCINLEVWAFENLI